MSSFELPRPDQRTLVLGSTGSGKTQMGVWLLSEANFHEMPWVIVDYKRDDLIGAIKGKQDITLRDMPKEPGVYHLRPNPVSDDENVDAWLLAAWRRRNIGLYVDEALRLPTKRSGAFETILTQGRSLHVPVISLSQRPVDLTRYAFSEANHIVMFRLTDKRDQKKVQEYIPIDEFPKLKKFSSMWYNVDQHLSFHMSPVPPKEEILKRFKERLADLGPQRRMI